MMNHKGSSPSPLPVNALERNHSNTIRGSSMKSNAVIRDSAISAESSSSRNAGRRTRTTDEKDGSMSLTAQIPSAGSSKMSLSSKSANPAVSPAETPATQLPSNTIVRDFAEEQEAGVNRGSENDENAQQDGSEYQQYTFGGFGPRDLRIFQACFALVWMFICVTELWMAFALAKQCPVNATPASRPSLLPVSDSFTFGNTSSSLDGHDRPILPRSLSLQESVAKRRPPRDFLLGFCQDQLLGLDVFTSFLLLTVSIQLPGLLFIVPIPGPWPLKSKGQLRFKPQPTHNVDDLEKLQKGMESMSVVLRNKRVWVWRFTVVVPALLVVSWTSSVAWLIRMGKVDGRFCVLGGLVTGGILLLRHMMLWILSGDEEANIWRKLCFWKRKTSEDTKKPCQDETVTTFFTEGIELQETATQRRVVRPRIDEIIVQSPYASNDALLVQHGGPFSKEKIKKDDKTISIQ